jgi:hypothetical protein
MKLEIDEKNLRYRIVDGEEDTEEYVTGPTASFGETATLTDFSGDEWEATIEADGSCTGVATSGGEEITLEFELGCDWDEEPQTAAADESADEEGDAEEEEATQG